MLAAKRSVPISLARRFTGLRFYTAIIVALLLSATASAQQQPSGVPTPPPAVQPEAQPEISKPGQVGAAPLQRDPMVTRDVGRGHNAVLLSQFSKFFRRALERHDVPV